MQYKLRGKNDAHSPIETVLANRGIKCWREYLGLKKASRDDYKLLDNINAAVKCFEEHIKNNDPVGILQDCDFDGVGSSTLMYKYIKTIDPDYNVKIYVHEKNKSHGLNDEDFDINDDVKLLIVPDAGSNEIEQHKVLKQRGIDCICLDHHQIIEDLSNTPAIVVNNQYSPNYPNKNCCGTHITMEFCRALDDLYWTDELDDYMDLVAVANVCDVMDISEFETRASVNEGFNNIQNKMLQEIIKAQEFSMKGEVTAHTVAFYVGPLVNAFIRIATYEERELLMRSFIEDESETFEYTKRGEDFPIEENIYEHVVRLMKSYKGKQDRRRDAGIKTILPQVSDSTDKVVIVNTTDILDAPLNGLTAIKISEKINKPVLLVRDTPDDLEGSGRAFDNCPIDDFRAFVKTCPYATFAAGHPSAFGVGISDIDNATKWFNDQLSDVDMVKVYKVDFIFDGNIDTMIIYELDEYSWLWGKGIEEPMVAVEDITLKRSDIMVQGKNFDSIAFMIDDIKYVAFKLPEDDELIAFASEWGGDEDDEITINIVGSVSINEYKNVYTPQVAIEEYEVIQ